LNMIEKPNSTGVSISEAAISTVEKSVDNTRKKLYFPVRAKFIIGHLRETVIDNKGLITEINYFSTG